MKGVLIFLLFLLPHTALLAKELGYMQSLLLIKPELMKIKPKDFYADEKSLFGVTNFKINNIAFQKRGKYKKENQYLPIRVRVKGTSIVTLGHNVFSKKKKKDHFDRIVDTRLKLNDFDEWKVEIINIEKTKADIPPPENIVTLNDLKDSYHYSFYHIDFVDVKKGDDFFLFHLIHTGCTMTHGHNVENYDDENYIEDYNMCGDIVSKELNGTHPKNLSIDNHLAQKYLPKIIEYFY